MSWSDDVRVMLGPFRGYATLADRQLDGPVQLWRGPLKWLLVVACFVSWTTSGQLTLDHLLLAPLSWSFAPIMMSAWVVVAARLFGDGSEPTRKIVDLYFAGHGPWFVLLTLLAGLTLFVPDVWQLLRWLLETRLLGVVLLVVMVWCGVLTFAMFRSGLGMSRRRSGWATTLFYLGYAGGLVGFFLVTGQLLPLWGVFW